MKYIRAKDGIYIPCEIDGYKDYYCLKGNTNVSRIEELNVLKQADTIEELCDCKVYRLNGTIKWIVKELADLGQCFEIIDFENWYGALDTDKGLIYVAKMNKKGELELL